MQIEKKNEHWKVTHRRCFGIGPIKNEARCWFCANKRECFAVIYLARIDKKTKKMRVFRYDL